MQDFILWSIPIKAGHRYSLTSELGYFTYSLYPEISLRVSYFISEWNIGIFFKLPLFVYFVPLLSFDLNML